MIYKYKNCIEHNKENGTIIINAERNNHTKISIKKMREWNWSGYVQRFYKEKTPTENSVGIGLS